MKAGFAKISINPPPGTAMYGFAARDREGICTGVHDDIFARALYLSHGDEEVLIFGFDLLFFHRREVDRYKGALGRKMGLLPKDILFNASHTHTGPMVGTAWTYAQHRMADLLYEDELENAILKAGLQAQANAKEATVWAGVTRSSVPMSRRKMGQDGILRFMPNPQGLVYDKLPVCLFKGPEDEPIALVFSISCHPSTVSGTLISSDYPGVAMDTLDKYLGAECSLFLQGTGGDSKASSIVQGDKWIVGTWDHVKDAGEMAAKEVIQLLDAGLTQVEPELKAALVEMDWPLEPALTKDEYLAIAQDSNVPEWRRLWAKRQAEILDRGRELATSVPIILHGIKMGKGLRMLGLEGEAVAGLGKFMDDFYREGITIPLGYTDGAQLYLPTSQVLEEGGYEAQSAWEYGWPAPFTKGIEDILARALEEIKVSGI